MNKKTKELNRINNDLDKKVNSENNVALTDIICYLRGANISEYDQEVIRQDLLEMVLSAQERGENIKTVIGDDYKTFCDDIIASLPQKTTKQKILYSVDIVCWSLSVLTLVNIIIAEETLELIRNLFTGGTLNYNISISQGSAVSSIIIIAASTVIVNYILKNSFKLTNESISKVKVFFMGAAMMAIFLFIAWVGSATLFTVNIFAALIFVLVLYIVHRILSKMQ